MSVLSITIGDPCRKRTRVTYPMSGILDGAGQELQSPPDWRMRLNHVISPKNSYFQGLACRIGIASTPCKERLGHILTIRDRDNSRIIEPRLCGENGLQGQVEPINRGAEESNR